MYSRTPLFRTKIEFPCIYPFFSVTVTISYFELGYFEFPAISNSSFSPFTFRQPRYFKLAKREYKNKLPSDQQRVSSVKQWRLSHATVCFLLREPRFDAKQASCHPQSTKVLEKNENNRTFKDIFQFNIIC